MKRHLITTLLLLATALTAFGDAIGTWTTYPCYRTITDIQPAGNLIYVQSGTNLYSYNTTDNSLQTYGKGYLLSGSAVSTIKWVAQTKTLLVCYTDYTIDIVYQNGDVTTITDIADKQMSADKTVNNISVDGKYAYLATGFGIIKLDTQNGYITDSYVFNRNISMATVVGSYIYAITDDAILQASTTSNMHDQTQWRTLAKGSWRHVLPYNGKPLAMRGDHADIIDPQTGTVEQIWDPWYTWMSYSDGHFVGGGGTTLRTLDTDGNKNIYYSTFDVTCLIYDPTNRCYWGNDATGQLVKYKLEGTSLEAMATPVIPDGPITDSSFRLAVSNGTLYVTGGIYSTRWNASTRSAQVMTLSDDGTWDAFQTEGLAEVSGGRYNNALNVAIDPRDATHVFLAGMNGLYEFRSGKFVKRYGTADGLLTYDDNSAKEYHVLITDVKYDSSNNLWVCLMHDRYPLAVLKNDGTWHMVRNYDSPVRDGVGKMWLDPTFDGNNVWFVDERTNTMSINRYSITDDKAYGYTAFTNQDGIALSPKKFSRMTWDKQGNLWFSTDIGPLYATPDNVQKGILTQHKVPRNDGTNYADYLLSDVVTTCVYVDAQNRKWIGTETNGVFLISSDCNTQLQHFTADNSPLLADCIFDIAINEQTGRVYFSTSAGLCSYMGDVTEQSSELSESSVWAYPNPVTPDYTGDITIVGLQSNCTIKILTASGQLVREGVTSGGSYTWDGRDLTGQRVASGVYMVHATTSDAETGIVTKVAIVR